MKRASFHELRSSDEPGVFSKPGGSPGELGGVLTNWASSDELGCLLTNWAPSHELGISAMTQHARP
jgi:sugar phosphate permease